ncbi:hypothetical protein C1H46_003821 [Malus baccata]|uniref:Uncharacterized protein n=1 Tax=Malus baccata TaxID=106549 RepID=A0A540NIY7_MALBA|nr:hypothetical protein C1H46_003821 [Malus baccata]
MAPMGEGPLGRELERDTGSGQQSHDKQGVGGGGGPPADPRRGVRGIGVVEDGDVVSPAAELTEVLIDSSCFLLSATASVASTMASKLKHLRKWHWVSEPIDMAVIFVAGATSMARLASYNQTCRICGAFRKATTCVGCGMSERFVPIFMPINTSSSAVAAETVKRNRRSLPTIDFFSKCDDAALIQICDGIGKDKDDAGWSREEVKMDYGVFGCLDGRQAAAGVLNQIQDGKVVVSMHPKRLLCDKYK